MFLQLDDDNNNTESNSTNSEIITDLDSNAPEDMLNALFDTMSYFEDAALEATFTKADHNHQEIN